MTRLILGWGSFRLRSVAPKDYESLPELQAPAGYILVIRDIDSDTFRLDGAANPKTFVAAVIDESERRFGIELVSILETEDLAASASALYDRHQARLSDAWLELDPFQIEELRRSVLTDRCPRESIPVAESGLRDRRRGAAKADFALRKAGRFVSAWI